MASSLLSIPQLADISMLDCPEHSHTSPTMTSSSVIVLYPLIVMVYGPPADGVVSITFHSAFGFPLVVIVFPSQLVVMVTSSVALAHPQKGTSAFCCSTM